MKLLDAVEQVLAETKAPLHISVLTKDILQRGLWQSAGKTPEQTVRAQISVDIKTLQSASRFQHTGKGTFALRCWGTLDPTQHPGPSTFPTPSSNLAAATVPTVSFIDAAEAVLNQCANQRPMHYKAITEQALKMGLLATQGQTPDATMYAQIFTEISRQQRRGKTPRFTKHGQGLFGLSKWLGAGLQSQINQHNAAIASKLHAGLFVMDPTKFEDLVGALLVKLGFENVVVTGRTNDGGIDVRGKLVIGDAIEINMAVQVKRWKKNVQKPTVNLTRGSLGNHEHGLIVTTSSFSPGAVLAAKPANAVPIGLMDGKKLVALLMEYELGVVRTAYDLYELA